jgi:ABC-type nickel/cobalt efflux system permease component RcnA
MVKVSNITKVRIVLSVILWAAGAVILLGGTAISAKSDNAWSTIILTGLVVLFGAYSSIRNEKISQLKPQYVRKS